jgi:hypothetical protein
MTKKILLALALGLAAASSRADVSDSGNLTIGGQGVIQGTMTVQGTGFSVGGTTFAVAGGSVTLGGRLNVSAAGIKWADGTVSVSSAGGVAGCAYNSTRTILATDYTTTATSTGTSITGGSITLTLSQTSRIWIRGFGSLRNNNGGSQTLLSAVVDGVPLTEIGTNAAFCHMIAVGGLENSRYWCGIDWTTASTFAAGSHTIDYRMWVTGNTGTLDCGEARCLFQAQEVCQ